MKIIALISLLVLASCGAPNVQVQSTKAENTSLSPKNMVFVTTKDLGLNQSQYSSFYLYTLKYLSNCGIRTNAVILKSKSADELKKITEAKNKFKPDSIMSIELSEQDGWTYSNRYGQNIGTDISEIKYLVTLADTANGKAVWKANLDLHPKSGNPAEAGTSLANAIIEKMKQDNLAPATCKPPTDVK